MREAPRNEGLTTERRLKGKDFSINIDFSKRIFKTRSQLNILRYLHIHQTNILYMRIYVINKYQYLTYHAMPKGDEEFYFIVGN